MAKEKRDVTSQEFTPPMTLDTWVRLGEHEDVPAELVGHLAVVTDVPLIRCNCEWSPVEHFHQDYRKPVTVKTRDEHDTTLELPVQAFSAKGQGRASVFPVG